MAATVPQLDAEGLRRFGLITGSIVAVLFGLLLPWLFERGYPVWPWLLAGGLWTFALFRPTALKPIHAGWMKVGHVLGWINTRIILGLVFFTIFVVVALILRLMRIDPLARRIDRSAASYRVPSRSRPSNHLERPF